MTVVVIVAIIAAFAIPAFTEQLRRSRRAEAVGGLQDFQLKMERWRGGHPSYANVVPADAEYPAQPTTTFYRFSIQGTPTATTYTLRATGLGPQSTGPCRIMEFQVSGTATVKAPPVATTSCWR